MTSTRLARGVVLVFVTTLAFAPGLTTNFTRYDDPLYVTENNPIRVRGWEGLAHQFDGGRAWSGSYIEFFPLRDSVYWVLFQSFGLKPLPFHLTSLFFHILSALLVWRLLELLGLAREHAWVGALVFALHPVHIESVVWIAGLKDPLYTSLMLGGLCAYARYRQAPTPWRYALTLAGLVAAFLVKSLAVAMPVVMLAMDLLLAPKEGWKQIATRLAGPFVISGIFMSMIIAIGRMNLVLIPPHGGSWASHLVLAAWAQVKYLKQAFVPTSYRLIYCFEPPNGVGDPRLWVAVGLLAGAGALAWRWRRQPLNLFLIAFYVATILPVSNVVPFPAIMADRYLYAPSIAVAGLLGVFVSRLRPRLVSLVTASVALLLTAGTASRVAIWRDEEALWQEADEDPACLVDASYPAAQSHILRYLSSKDPRTRLAALERAAESPGLKGVGQQLYCTTFIGAALEAIALDDRAAALSWVRRSTTRCPHFAQAWNAAMLLSLHENPRLAAGAAIKAWRLAKTADAEMLMWLTLLEAGESNAQAQVSRLARQDDVSHCGRILQFVAEVPRLAAEVPDAVKRCEALMARHQADPRR